METEVTLEDIKQESDTWPAFYKDPLTSVLKSVSDGWEVWYFL